MPFLKKIKNSLKSDWVISLGLFFIFLLTNGYTYAWDDQHLEIPLLKSLIDPQLYPDDYYVEALKKNFISFLFPILAKIITVEQIPSAYFILYLISRFFLFFYAYRLWKIITKDRLNAALCVFSVILIFRVEEFLYRTFSHQEFALAIIMAALYYFYKSRFARAAILLGIAANFHALYSFFPFCYMMLYLFWKRGEDNGKTFWKSAGLTALFGAPVFVWTVIRFLNRGPVDLSIFKNWVDLYYIACPATFLFDNVRFAQMFKSFSFFFKGTQQFWPALGLWALNFFFNPDFRKDQKTQAVLLGGVAFIFISFIFTYMIPVRFVLDLNLVRNLQYINFFLVGYTTILLIKTVNTRRFEIAIVAIFLFSLLRFNHLHISHSAKVSITLIAVILAIIYFFNRFNKNPGLKVIALLVPFIIVGVQSTYYHKIRLEIERSAGGFWQLQRNWIDMQNFVRKNTPKSALILTPNDMEMGGFRIFSERRVLVCYRDCGVIGFDFAAARQWQRRLADVTHFKVIVTEDISTDLLYAIKKYKVNYIVFMRYLNPGKNTMLDPLYENETFALYRVVANPL